MNTYRFPIPMVGFYMEHVRIVAIQAFRDSKSVPCLYVDIKDYFAIVDELGARAQFGYSIHGRCLLIDLGLDQEIIVVPVNDPEAAHE